MRHFCDFQTLWVKLPKYSNHRTFFLSLKIRGQINKRRCVLRDRKTWRIQALFQSVICYFVRVAIMIGFQFCEKCAKSWQKTSLWHSMEPIAFTDLICSLEASSQQWRVSIRLVMHTAAKKSLKTRMRAKRASEFRFL